MKNYFFCFFIKKRVVGYRSQPPTKLNKYFMIVIPVNQIWCKGTYFPRHAQYLKYGKSVATLTIFMCRQRSVLRRQLWLSSLLMLVI